MKSKKNIFLVVGARPNFMKAAPLYNQLKKSKMLNPLLIHTGQHYDYEMSKSFFEDLSLPEPDFFLNCGSGTHAEQTAKIMIEFEKVLISEKVNLVVVFGDVNSTIASALTAKKLNIPVAHVEAGLRSFDESMPEEINRKLTDAISDFLFTPSKDGNENLLKEGVAMEKIFFVGNIMIDSLKMVIDHLSDTYIMNVLHRFKLNIRHYGLITLHRPFNVDMKNRLFSIMKCLRNISKKIKIIFPMHPRTKKSIESMGIRFHSDDNLTLIQPLGYKNFIALEKNAGFVLTDSGGIQEETTYLHVPCLTLRPNTERPITIKEGTNKLVKLESLEREVFKIISKFHPEEFVKSNKTISYWDGKTGERIAEILNKKIG